MHIAEAARGRWIEKAMLAHLLGVTRTQGYRRVSLETETTAALCALPRRGLITQRGEDRPASESRAE